MYILFAAWLLASADALHFDQAWIRLPPPGAGMAAGYVEIDNRSERPVVLTAVSSGRFAGAMFHNTSVEDGVARMRHLDVVTVPAGGEFIFAPGGAHLMLARPSEPLQEGERVMLELSTADGERYQVEFEVRR